MNAKIITLIAAAVLSAPLATNALARDYGHDHGHRHGYRERTYGVRFHVDGSQRIHADGHRDAHRLEDYLESLGADAHIDGDHEVHFRMRGERTRTFYSHERAHEFARSLRRLGFHVRIVE